MCINMFVNVNECKVPEFCTISTTIELVTLKTTKEYGNNYKAKACLVWVINSIPENMRLMTEEKLLVPLLVCQ